MKVVIDPETPFPSFRIDREFKRPVLPTGVSPVFSPFDENALESALKIKDWRKCGVTILSLGKALPKALLQKALAAGADDAIAVEDPGLVADPKTKSMPQITRMQPSEMKGAVDA